MVPAARGRERAVARWSIVVLVLLCAIALIRIADTYRTFNHTADEVLHIGVAMEYVDGGRYSYEFLHPPMRAVFAIGPRIIGRHFANSPDMLQEGNSVLYGGDRYFKNLTAARIGALPFFLVTVAFIFLWAHLVAGPLAAGFSAAAYTTLPLALAHAGLATTDTLVTATLLIALFSWSRLLAQPSPSRLLLFALTAGLAITSKFSALYFLAVVVCITGIGWIVGVPMIAGHFAHESRRRRLIMAALATLSSAFVCAIVIWSMYRFSLESLSNFGRGTTLSHQFPQQLQAVAQVLVVTPIPAPEFFFGVHELLLKNSAGHEAFFLGAIRQHGHPAFFPVALLVKTPIPFLILAGVGAVALTRTAWRQNNPMALLPPLAAVLIVLVCVPSRINIGLRHLLPIFPLLAICAGVGAGKLWRRGRPEKWFLRAIVLALFGWQVLAGARAHPDYLAYFNECCAAEPQRWLVDSDLDWGQDLERLSVELKRRGVDQLHLAYFGSADPKRHGLPSFDPLPPYKPVRGWVAISEWQFAMGTNAPPYDRYRWLLKHQPVARVGKSIRLYRIP